MMTKTLLIHWIREKEREQKAFDSMRVSANIERLTAAAILYLDLPNPFLIRGFPVLLSALSSKKLKEFRFVLDFSFFENLEWQKSLERTLFFLHEKKLKFTVCELAHPSLFDGPPKPDRWFKKKLSDQGVQFMFVPFYGEFEGKIYPESYTDAEKIYFEFPSENVIVYQAANLESDEFLTPDEKMQRFLGQSS